MEISPQSQQLDLKSLDSMPGAVVIVDQDGRIVIANDQAQRLFGYPREELLNRPVALLIPERSGVHHPARVRGLLEYPYVLPAGADLNLFGRRKDGTEFPAEISISPVKVEGQVLVAAAVRDVTERRQLERAMRRRTLELEDFIENSSLALHWLGPDGTILWANQAELDLLGYAREEYVGHDIRKFHASLSVIDELLRRLEQNQKPANYSARLKCKDGSLRDVLIDASAYRENGEFVHASCFARDVTDRKRAAAELKRRERDLDEAQQLGHVGSWARDFDDNTLTWSAEMLRILGFDAEQTVPTVEALMERVHPDDRGMVERAMASARESRTPIDVDHRIVRPDGTERLVRATLRFQVDPSGQTRRIFGTIQDVTEERRAVEVLHQREAQLSLMFNSTSDLYALYRVEPKDRLVVEAINPAIAKRLVKRMGAGNSSVLIGLNVSEMLVRAGLPSDVVARRLAQFLQVRDEKVTIRYESEWPGSVDYEVLDVVLQPVLDRQGQCTHLLWCGRSISERIRAEHAREKLQTQLAEAQKLESIGRLAGGVAHDFNNLLTIINGFTALLLEQLPVEDPARLSLQSIAHAGDTAAALVSQLLAYSRRQRLNPVTLSLNTVVSNVKKLLGRLLRENIEIVCNLTPDLDLVMVDRAQIEQMIINLAVNARDAMPRGGILTIETHRREAIKRGLWCPTALPLGDYMELIVRDTGTGMDEQTRGQVFEPFLTTKEVGKGTGLGLSMVQGVVSQSGGCIGVESEEGKGSAFHVYLPASKHGPAGDKPVAVATGLAGKEAILLVEDNEDVRRFTAQALKRLGYTVVDAQDATEAIAACVRQNFDVLLTDVIMPGMGGIELAGRVASMRPKMKLLLMSAHSEDAVEGLIAGSNRLPLLSKPFTLEALRKTLQDLLQPADPNLM